MRLVELVLPVPPSVNNLYNVGMSRGMATVRKSRAARRYEKEAGMEILAQTHKKVRTEGPLALTVRLYFNGSRRRDADNAVKLLQDVLAKTLDFDDAWITDLHIFKRIDKDNPRAVVELRRSLRSGDPKEEKEAV